MLTDPNKRRYARQILVRELGLAGQERLCATTVRLSAGADSGAAAVAADYLARAGVRPPEAAGSLPPSAADTGDGLVDVPGPELVHAIAGDAALVDCAAWLAGAYAAVETIKRVAGIGSEARLDPTLTLGGGSQPRAASSGASAGAGRGTEVR